MRRSLLLIVSACSLLSCTLPLSANAKCDVVLDTSQINAVTAFAKKAQAVADEWYSRAIKILGADESKAPKRITIVMDLNMDGVAATAGDEIRVSARYVQQHPDDVGLVVHELTHAVQSYPKYDPVWLIEGIADYVRFYNYEPVSQRPHPNPEKAKYTDSYRTTAAFLDFAAGKYDRNLIKKLDRALKDGTYTPDLFKQATGKDLDQLNTEWLASLAAKK